ncbi:MAG: hypothetical protein LBU46_05820 [Candidatus Accumulibacter sp.]|jgi:hypothetical protein|nr:hypothetical protein [Accumulibacter sp.]
MNREKVWEAMSYAWTEIDLDGDEFRCFAREIDAQPHEMALFNRAVFWDTCGAFAVETVFEILSLRTTAPDWYFPEAVQKVAHWLRRPLLLSLLNPLWLVGYPLSCLGAVSYWFKLRRAVFSSA